MILHLKSGGLKALIIGWLIVIAAKFMWFMHPDIRSGEVTPVKTLFGTVSISVLPAVLIVVTLLVVLGIWLNNIVRKEGFLDRNNPLVFFGFLLANLLSPAHLTSIGPMVGLASVLYVFYRLLSLTDEDMGSSRIFIDGGTVYGLGLLIYPRGIFLFPLILFAFRQFSVFDFNRVLIVVLSILMILATAVMSSYAVAGVWINPEFDFFKLAGPEEWKSWTGSPGFKSLAVLLIGTLFFFPFLIQAVGQSQIRQRRLVRLFWLIPVFYIPFFFLSDGMNETQFWALPFALSWAIAVNRTNQPLLANLLALFMIWGLLVIQWSVF